MAHLSPSLSTSPFPSGLLMALPAGQGLLPVTDSLHESERLGEAGGAEGEGRRVVGSGPLPNLAAGTLGT